MKENLRFANNDDISKLFDEKGLKVNERKELFFMLYWLVCRYNYDLNYKHGNFP